MLSQLRKGAASWVAKIFIGILILSFAVWGVEGLMLNSTETVLAKVGDVEVTRSDFEKLYPTVIGEWNQRLKSRLTRQQIKAFDIPSQVKYRLINQAVVDNHVQQLNLGVSDNEIGEAIKNDPQLRDGVGQFNKELLKQILRSQRVSEQQYFDEQRTAALRTQITSIFTQQKAIPEVLINGLYHYREDKVEVEYFVVPETGIKPPSPPSDAELKDYYEKTKRSHEAPEYRKASLFILSLDELAKKTKISQQDIETAYKARKNSFITPASRSYDQLIFESMETALEAHKALEKGEKFEDVAKKFSKDKKADSVGPVTKTTMADAALAKAIFALKVGEYTVPIQGTFAITIAKVSKATERVEKSLKDATADLTKLLQNRAARAEIKSLYDKVEDLRASGMSIDEVSVEMGTKPMVIDAIDQSSAGVDGKAVANLPPTKRLTAAIFDADIGDDTVPVRHQDGGYVWFDVLKITPKRIKSFDEVKAKVLEQLTNSRKKANASDFVVDLVKKIEAGAKFSKVAASLKAKIVKPDAFGRGTSGKDIPVVFANQLFSVKKDGVASGLSNDNKRWLIVKLKRHVPAKTEGPAYDAYRTKLDNEMQSELTADLVTQYLEGARARFGVQENAQVFDQLKNGL